MTAAQLELITAAVDGELSPTDKRAFRALIAGSLEARALYAELKADRTRIRALPRVAPPADLQAKIMARVAQCVPTQPAKPQPHAEPTRPVVRRRASRGGIWVPVAVAASVLFCAAAGLFAFFNGSGPKNHHTTNSWANVLPSQRDASTTPGRPAARPGGPSAPSDGVRVDVLPVPPVPVPREVPPTVVATAPAPRTVSPDLIGFPVLPKLPPFERVEIRVPFLRPVSDLGREDVGQELLDELRHDSAFKFDLFVRDAARGVEVFQNAARASGLTLHADAATLEKLKKKQVHSVVIYTESLSAAELVALFAKLTTEDAKFSPKVCDSLHATAVARSDELELKAILGSDVGLFKRPISGGASTGTGSAGDRSAPAKSVNSETIDRVVQSVTNPSGKASDKSAALLTWQTTHPSIARTTPATSHELKQYLQKRGERKSSAVPALIVIRVGG